MAVLLRDDSSADTAARRMGRVAAERRVRAVVVDVLLLIGAILVTHLAISGPIPSGGDGGNWLALAREMAGAKVMSADVAYEPVFIGLVAVVIPIFGLLGALVAGAFVAESVLVLAMYVMVRPVGRIQALVSATVVLFLGYRLEAVAWGAYPQILGLGFGLMTLWALLSYLNGRSNRFLLAGLVGCLFTLLTHKLVGALLLAAAPAAAAYLLWLSRWDRTVLKRSVLGVGAVALLGAGFAWSWWAGTSVGVEPTLNPLGMTLAEQIERAFRGSVVPWIAIGCLMAMGIGIRSWKRSEGIVVAAGFGWLAASIVAFVATGEPRVLIQAQVAAIPVAVIVGWRLRKSSQGHGGWRRAAPVAAGIALAALFGSVVLTGAAHYDQSSDWYRVAGQAQLAALDDLGSLADDGDLVVASRGPNGNPIGWWVEGYGGLPTYTSIDLGYLAFPDERSQALSAASVFEESPEHAAAMLDEIGARFLILDRRGPDASWLGGGEPVGLDVVSDGTLLILEVPDGS